MSGSNPQKEIAVLSTIAVVLLALWIIGMITGNMIGGLVHLLLVGAAVLFIIQRGQGASPLRRG